MIINTKIKNKTYWFFCFLLIITLFISHLFFLSADPDVHISFSRGPFTDEGLNTCQLRNFINYGYLSFNECDNLVKTPLFNAILFLPFEIFGTSHLAGRLTILLLVIGMLFYICTLKKIRYILPVLIGTVFLKYQIHQFSHFCLAEMLSVSLFTMAILFFFLYATNAGKPKTFLILSQVFIFGAFVAKIQFIYLLPFALLATPIDYFINPYDKKLFFKNFRYLCFTLIGLSLCFIFFWYLPLQKTFDYMMANQSGTFKINGETGEIIKNNIRDIFFNDVNYIYSSVFCIFLLTGFLIFFFFKRIEFRTIFICAVLWFLLETHKLTMGYLPTRYLISFYFSMGLLISVVISELLFHPIFQKRNGLVKIVSFCIFMLLFCQNITTLYTTYRQRTFVLKEANAYLAKYSYNQPIIGAWAPALCWDCKARTLPVWNNFLNYKNPIQEYKPRIIISETDETDSEKAYLANGIILSEKADSVKKYHIGSWDVNLYWIKPEK